jgi:excisionase family DNA binding protein
LNLDIDVASVPREDLPALLGRLVELEARVRMRLAESSAPAPCAVASRLLNPDEAAAIAGVSRRSILTKTRGQMFRRDISRKTVRFDEVGLRRWLTTSRKRAAALAGDEETEDLLLSSAAAQILGVSAASVRDWVSSGKLPAIRTAGGWRVIRKKDVLSLAAERARLRGR